MESGNENYYTQGIRKDNWNWNSKFVGEHIRKRKLVKLKRTPFFDGLNDGIWPKSDVRHGRATSLARQPVFTKNILNFSSKFNIVKRPHENRKIALFDLEIIPTSHRDQLLTTSHSVGIKEVFWRGIGK